MWYDDNIKSYGDINYKINQSYCEKYNLEIICSHKKMHPTRCAMWERLPLLLQNLSNYDYMIWIDADAFFYFEASNILDIIIDNPTPNFIFSNDLGNRNINTGFFIVKNSQYSIDFLNRWAFDEELFKTNPYPYWPDQGVLIDMYETNIMSIKDNSVLYDYGRLQHFFKNDKNDKCYVFHLAGRQTYDRNRESEEYYRILFGKSFR
jgi:hypothetical protein